MSVGSTAPQEPVPGPEEGTVVFGDLTWVPALHRPDLLGDPVRSAVEELARTTPESARQVLVAPIDPDLADTAAMTEAYHLPLAASANCVLVAGKRAGEERVAACVVLATTRADVNTVVRKALDVRKASFWPMEQAVSASGMEYGAITPVGTPTPWRLLLDTAVTTRAVIVGSGIRGSKLLLPGAVLAALPRAEVVTGLGVPVT